MMTTTRLRFLLLGGCAAMLAGCSSNSDVFSDKAIDYKREAQAQRNLEIPPDLTSGRVNDRMSVPDTLGDGTSYSEYEVDRKARGIGGSNYSTGQVLPDDPNVTVERDGDARWLVVDGDADAVWDRVLDFWQDLGIPLEEQDPQIGIMRTAWLENRANVSRDFVTDTIRRVFDGLYETSLRDAYRVRFEREGNAATEIYLTHYGLEEELINGASNEVERTVWQPRPRDPELEVEMLRRLMVYLGTAEQRAQAQLAANKQRGQARAQLILGSDKAPRLIIADDFPSAWRRVGLALDRVGFAVEDRDRSRGLYYVSYNDPANRDSTEGFFGALKFWEEKPEPNTRYIIKVDNYQNNISVRIFNGAEELDSSDTAKRILSLLRDEV